MPELQTLRILDDFSWKCVEEEWGILSEIIHNCRLRRHPLGFVHGELITRDRTTVRLHIWDSMQRVVQEPQWFIHTHIFDLKSIVLTGSLTNRLYIWHEDRIEPNNRIYRINYAGDVSRLESTDQLGRCEMISSEDVNTGQSYAVDVGKFHNTFVLDGLFTATIALTIKSPGTPLVVGTTDGEPFYSYERRELSGEDRARLVGELFARVKI